MESDTPRTDVKELVARDTQALGLVVFVDEDERVVDAKFARELERELAAMEVQRDEARRDAERYRWLKSPGCYWVEIQSEPSGNLIFQGRRGHAFYHHQGTAEMDDVIDSCIAAMRKEGGGA
jgi:hypothetical protein